MAESTAFARRGYKGGAKASTIPAGISNSATTFAGADLSTWAGCATNGPVTVVFERGFATEEIGEFTTIAGNNVSSLTRGLRGTSAVQHPANCTIELVSSDRDFDEANKGAFELLSRATTAGQRPYVTGAQTLAMLAAGTAGQIEAMNDTATAPINVNTPPLFSWKQAVRVTTTANGTLATAYANGQTVDGIVIATGDRVLLKNQTTGSENGICVVAASGAPTRATDFDAASKCVPSSLVAVQEGTAGAGTCWRLSNTGTVTPGSTAMTFAQFGASASVGDLLSEKFYRKTSDQSVTSSTTLVDVTTLGHAVAANEVWVVDAFVRIVGNGTGDIKFAFTVPAAATIMGAALNGVGDAGAPADNVADDPAMRYVAFTSSGASQSFANGTLELMYHLHVVVVNGANAGSVQLQFAQATSNGTATSVLTNSHMIARRYA